jgi:hypothetical protein
LGRRGSDEKIANDPAAECGCKGQHHQAEEIQIAADGPNAPSTAKTKVPVRSSTDNNTSARYGLGMGDVMRSELTAHRATSLN